MAGMVASSCEHTGNMPDSGAHEILLVAQSVDRGMTRASDGLYASATGFDGTEQVQVWMKGSGAVTQAIYKVGVPAAGKSRLTAVAAALEYPVEEDVTIWALYPSTSASSHVVAHDQRSTRTNSTAGDAAYKASDLMYAKVRVPVTTQQAEQGLAFDHLMTKLRIQVVKAAGVSCLSSVTLCGVKRRVSVSSSDTGVVLGTPAATQSGDDGFDADVAKNNSIIVGGEEAEDNTQQVYIYTCVLPAQEWDDSPFLTVVADGEEYVYKTTKSLLQGQLYNVTLTVEPGLIGSAPLWAGPLATRSDNDENSMIHPEE